MACRRKNVGMVVDEKELWKNEDRWGVMAAY
jgi:hypothetical protein